MPSLLRTAFFGEQLVAFCCPSFPSVCAESGWAKSLLRLPRINNCQPYSKYACVAVWWEILERAASTAAHPPPHLITPTHTSRRYDSVFPHCQVSSALRPFPPRCPPKVRAEQALLTELESEWLNQFWVQGRRHAVLHPWWRGPMALVLATWRELERRTALTVQRLMSLGDEEGQGLAAAAEPSAIARAFETVLRVLEERRESRSRWASRFADPAYRSLPEDCAPVVPALWASADGGEGKGGGAGSALPRSLAGVISRLRECYTAVYRAASGGKKAGSAKAIAAGAASNWELFRAGSAPASASGKKGGAPKQRKQRHQGGGDRAGGKDGKKRPGGGSSVVGGRTGGGGAGGRGPKRKRSNKRREG